ncbi:hypothetical protein U0070_004709 [Myodes glareolus]|uniref:Uncharacterized protein n=1 Tax=Myodes glareolus TaxID=447135 RepID=A0AAW0I9T5_MYOGA
MEYTESSREDTLSKDNNNSSSGTIKLSLNLTGRLQGREPWQCPDSLDLVKPESTRSTTHANGKLTSFPSLPPSTSALYTRDLPPKDKKEKRREEKRREEKRREKKNKSHLAAPLGKTGSTFRCTCATPPSISPASLFSITSSSTSVSSNAAASGFCYNISTPSHQDSQISCCRPSHGDPVALVPQHQSLHEIQQLIVGVDVGVCTHWTAKKSLPLVHSEIILPGRHNERKDEQDSAFCPAAVPRADSRAPDSGASQLRAHGDKLTLPGMNCILRGQTSLHRTEQNIWAETGRCTCLELSFSVLRGFWTVCTDSLQLLGMLWVGDDSLNRKAPFTAKEKTCLNRTFSILLKQEATQMTVQPLFCCAFMQTKEQYLKANASSSKVIPTLACRDHRLEPPHPAYFFKHLKRCSITDNIFISSTEDVTEGVERFEELEAGEESCEMESLDMETSLHSKELDWKEGERPRKKKAVPSLLLLHLNCANVAAEHLDKEQLCLASLCSPSHPISCSPSPAIGTSSDGCGLRCTREHLL